MHYCQRHFQKRKNTQGEERFHREKRQQTGDKAIKVFNVIRLASIVSLF